MKIFITGGVGKLISYIYTQEGVQSYWKICMFLRKFLVWVMVKLESAVHLTM